MNDDQTRRGQTGSEDFGRFWKTHEGSNEWYTWMYNYRILQHLAFQKWFQYIRRVEDVATVADFGCGTGVGYPEFFKDYRFVGIDLAPNVIDWCKRHNSNPAHEYRSLEFIKDPPNKEFDLVFSHGTIDNVYDMNEFLVSATRSARKWIYVTAYRGFFPCLTRHRYDFNADERVYYNDISPSEAYCTLRDAGCRDIAVYPSATGREDIPFETVIVAHA